MGEKILTLHPQGLNGVRIERSKYDQMRQTILHVLRENDSLAFNELSGGGSNRNCRDSSMDRSVGIALQSN